MLKKFQGVLESIGTTPSRVIVRLPFDPKQVWANQTAGVPRLRVKGTIRSAQKTAKRTEAFPFSGSLLGKRQGDYLLVVTQKMQRGANTAPGGLVAIELELDLDDKPTPMPVELAKLLKSDRSAVKWFDRLNDSWKRYIAAMISEPKSAETRQRRAEQWAEWMMLTMEGELEIPPILKVAFRAHPQAQAGWESLTPNSRRTYLFTIFSAKSPEARANRVEAALANSLRAATRRKAPKHTPEIDE